VAFLIGIVISYARQWGINVDFTNPSLPEYTPLFRWSLFSLSGTLGLGLFIHNAIITIMRNNKHQENNARDTTLGFLLVLLTYLFIGFIFYVTFPLPKECISDVRGKKSRSE